MARSPVVLATYTAMSDAIDGPGTFDGCEYCQAAHTVSAKRAGLS